MKPPEEARLLLVRQWIAKAEINYRTAERIVRDDEPIRESITFHCQQAAEKYHPRMHQNERGGAESESAAPAA